MTNSIKFGALTALLLSVSVLALACGGGYSGNICEDAEITYGSDGTPDLNNCNLFIAVENAYQPFNFIDPDTGEGVGYDYDFFNEFCDRANCNTEYAETSWETMLAIMAGNGTAEFDVGANGVTITPQRAENVDFSDPYYRVNEVLIVQIDEDRFSNVDEFVADDSLKIGTQSGTTNAMSAVELVGDSRVQQTMQFGDAVQLLLAGDVDAVIIDDFGGAGYTGANADELKVLDGPPVSDDGGLGFIFVQGSQLVRPINWAIETFRADGTLARIESDWDPADG